MASENDNNEDIPKAYLDLVRTLTHEVRTPLSTIIGFADMIENEMLGPLGNHRYRDYAEDIHKAARAILETLDDVSQPAHFAKYQEAEEDFRHLIELAPDLICICREGRIELINPAGASMLGVWPLETLKDRLFYDFVDPEFRDIVSPDLLDLAKEKLRVPIKLVRSDELIVDVEIAALPYSATETEETDAVMVIARDVTERNRAISAVRQREENLQLVMDAVADGIVSLDEHGQIEMVNEAIERIFGYDADALMDQHIGLLIPALADTQPQSFVSDDTSAGDDFGLESDTEMTGRHIEGQNIPIEVVFTVSSSAGRRRYIGAVRDITSRKNYENRLRTLATRDELTGLANKNLLSERLTEAMRQIDIEGGGLALIYVDLDQFQNINDAFGHEVGDEVLLMASRRLQSCVRDGDTIARVGGDEFHILMPGVSDEDEAAHLAGDLLVALSSPYLIEGREIYSSASIGVCTYPVQADTLSELMRNVDTAANNAKRDGRANYKIYTPSMSEEVHRRVEIGHQLRRALENDELSLTYQAKVDLSSQRIIGAEALLRWSNEQLGVVSPAEFVPIAEETGLIVPIGEWVLRSACREAAQWRTSDGSPVQVAVNLSALQFLHGDLVARVTRSLRESGLDPERLDLELTESLLVERPDETISTLNRLKSLGISISMDDFGTGYSSLSYLTRFPLDSMKIDRAFVTDLPDDRDAVVVVRAIVGMAKQLDLHIVAEGIETERQMEFLHGLGCHTGQGYLFSKPVTNAQFQELLLAKAAE
ncbi:MAG: EAL domain-containing protein [Rhodospirillales bacterium]|nr:EAL domain-containing protein [Rhodospirillales bacterium]MBO6788496.1 EAL domain-containing protein [Rhodospirillales bacterium]